MSSGARTPNEAHKHKHKRLEDELSSMKRKREERSHQDSVAATPTTSKRPRQENDTTVNHEILANEDRTAQPVKTPAKPEASPFFIQTTSFYLALSPIGQAHPLESLCAEHLSPLLLTYYPPLKGVVLSYQNPRLSSDPSAEYADGVGVLAKSVDEYAVSYVWVTADFTILKPMKGIWAEGHVSVQSESHLGLVCWNLFNASIDQKSLPRKWRWVGPSTRDKRQKKNQNGATKGENDDGEGHFVDAEGARVEGVIKFRVRDLENLTEFAKDKGFMSIEGTLLTREEEEKAARDEARRVPRNRERTIEA